MDVYDAIELVDKQYKEHQPGYLDNWSVWGYLPLFDTVEEVLALNYASDFKASAEQAREIKRQYIQKKLNYL
jgi:hypothetical protein